MTALVDCFVPSTLTGMTRSMYLDSIPLPKFYLFIYFICRVRRKIREGSDEKFQFSSSFYARIFYPGGVGDSDDYANGLFRSRLLVEVQFLFSYQVPRWLLMSPVIQVGLHISFLRWRHSR
jgi:hypothetical protein